VQSGAIVLLASLLLWEAGPIDHRRTDARRETGSRVVTNDNRKPAGSLREGRLELALDVVDGQWFPEAEGGPSITVQAFAQHGQAPSIPGPLVRVKEGTEIHVVIHNTLDSEAVIHGLHTRPATSDDLLRIPAGETREATFVAGAPGTYFYWGSTTRKPLQFRAGKDSQLSGAIIVDPSSASPSADRTFVIGLYSEDPDSAAGRTPHPREIVVINGKAWPHTERFTFTEGDTVAWRVINASAAPHPMHLHGFYFQLERTGFEGADNPLPVSAIKQANTNLLPPGSTMAIRFVVNRPGNWLFHCHLAVHVDGSNTLENILHRHPIEEAAAPHDGMHDAHEMGGLIIGIHVLPRGEQRAASTKAPLRLRLVIQPSPYGYNGNPAYGFVLQESADPRRDSVMLPGPTLFLEKDRPTRITLVNRLTVPTSVHWHGLEIESYPDGVAGWSGTPGRIAPAIQPNDSFIAEFTPPRAGTFMYHSHINELLQTNSGMYGAIIVTDSAHRFDPRIDKIILVGGGGPGNIERRSGAMVNGSIRPQMDLEAGTTYRLHIIQIHPQAIVVFRLGNDSTTAVWTPVAKDGADLPPEQAKQRPARVVMGAGENGEYLYTPQRPGLERLEMRTQLAGWYVPMVLNVRPAGRLVTN
jgi:FtsP/CotA-like multicopper oxidase with cupredoxin domain